MRNIAKFLRLGLFLCWAIGVPIRFVSGQESEKIELVQQLRTAFPDRTGNQIEVLSFVRESAKKKNLAVKDNDEPARHGGEKTHDDSWTIHELSRVAIPKETIPARKAVFTYLQHPDGKHEFSVMERQYRANEVILAKGGIVDLKLSLPLDEIPAPVLDPKSLWLSGALYAKSYNSVQPSVTQAIFEEILIDSVFFGVFHSDGVITSIHSSDFAQSCVVVEGKGDHERVLKNEAARLEFQFCSGKLQGWFDKETYKDKTWTSEYRVVTVGEHGEVTTFSGGRVPNPESIRYVLKETIPISIEDLKQWSAFHIEDGVKVQKEGDASPFYVLVNDEICTPIDPEAEGLIERELKDQTDRPPISIDQTNSGFVRKPYLNSSASSTHCGVYSLAWCAARCGIRIPLNEIVANKYFTSRYGSSIPDLKRAAKDFGLSAEAVSNASIDLLRRFDGPAILHFKNADGAGGHWIVCDGFADNGNVVIVDLPNDRMEISPAELMTYWDAVAILVSREDKLGRSNGFGMRSRLRQAMPIGLLLVLLIGFGRFSAFKRDRFGVNSLILLVLSLVIGVTWSFASEFSYLNNPDAVRLAAAKSVFSTESVRVHNDRDRLSTTNVQLIDARKPSDFSHGKIGDAINLPINCRLGEFVTVTANLNKEFPTVVYCMNSHCLWADQIAKRLELLGFKDVSVYRPGYHGYIKMDSFQEFETNQLDRFIK